MQITAALRPQAGILNHNQILVCEPQLVLTVVNGHVRTQNFGFFQAIASCQRVLTAEQQETLPIPSYSITDHAPGAKFFLKNMPSFHVYKLHASSGLQIQ